MRGKEFSGEIDAASPRLALTGTGRIALTPRSDAELTFRFHDSSLDPYVRLYVPRLSPFTTAVATGSIRIVGPLADLEHLKVDGVVDTIDMRLLDYAIRNAAPVRLSLANQQVNVGELELIGEDTRLRVSGTVGLREQRIALKAAGDANLGILQGFFRDVRGAGRAELAAEINGPLDRPLFSGSASIADGRIRHFSLPKKVSGSRVFVDFEGVMVGAEPSINGLGAKVHRPLERRFRHGALAGPRHEQHQSVSGLDLGIARKVPSRALKKR